MATLTANISSSANSFTVTGDVSGARTTAEYRIDDEIITLRKFARELFGVANPWGQINRSKWVVSRGVNGTTAASHLAGAAIVAVEEAVTTGVTLAPPEPFAGEGGDSGVPDPAAAPDGQVVSTLSGAYTLESVAGLQTVRLLGPYRVNWNTPNITDGVELEPLSTTQTVMAAWVEVVTAWDADINDARIDVCAGGADWALGDFWPITQALVGSNVASEMDANNAPAALPRDINGAQNRPVRVVTAGALVAQAVGVAGAAAGAADVYALVAEPSA